MYARTLIPKVEIRGTIPFGFFDSTEGQIYQHRPERTLLYQIVEQYYPVFADLMVVQGRPLPEYV
jgi:hypothetical protein